MPDYAYVVVEARGASLLPSAFPPAREQERSFSARGRAVVVFEAACAGNREEGMADDRLTVRFNTSSFSLSGDGERVCLPTGHQVRGHLRTLAKVFAEMDAAECVMLLGEDGRERGIMHLYDPATGAVETSPLSSMRTRQGALEYRGIRVVRADQRPS